MIAELSKIYEVGRGTFGKGRPKLEEDILSSSKEGKDVLEKTAKAVGVNEKTVQRARAYEKIVKEKQDMKGILIKNLDKKIKGLEQKINIILLKCPLC